ncbi:MAG: hypothetical protein A2293_12455 [Elusimicrobia bacterium RIFOXYB2_FULL_49_7]|nr:MAG: hypothetical protein A2293_12455 [Elusimicrobia bacterium RIFOXYB2_FULL_49_7]
MRLVIIILFVALNAVAINSDFFGGLIVRTDTGDTLPVYLDNTYIGLTPLKVDSLNVGQHSVSFLEETIKDSLLNRKKTELPLKVKSAFSSTLPNQVAAMSTFKVLIKNQEMYEAVIQTQDIRVSSGSVVRGQYLKLALVSTLLVGLFAVILIQVF